MPPTSQDSGTTSEGFSDHLKPGLAWALRIFALGFLVTSRLKSGTGLPSILLLSLLDVPHLCVSALPFVELSWACLVPDSHRDVLCHTYMD